MKYRSPCRRGRARRIAAVCAFLIAFAACFALPAPAGGGDATAVPGRPVTAGPAAGRDVNDVNDVAGDDGNDVDGALPLEPSAAAESPPAETPPPWLRLTAHDAFQSAHPLLAPGKIDFLYRRSPDANEYNAFWWSPVFKGGAGILDPDGADSLEYFGGYVRPLAARPDLGDLIVGALGTERAVQDAWEAQGEYRFPFGLGFGGGVAEFAGSPDDIAFGKVTYRDRIARLEFILEVQAQEVGGEVSPGGYAALYDEQVMAVGGHDGEQWRATLGATSPRLLPWLRPSAEVLYTDNSIGDADGARFLFINATLDYQGGFLSHPARLGRAMGPQGIEYGNPLGFLVPTWNRRLDLWELGGTVDFRLVRTKAPSGDVTEKLEALVYPFGIFRTGTVFDGFFAGGSFARIPGDDTPGVLAGFSGKIAFLNLSAAWEYATRTDESTVTVGLIDAF